MKLNDPDTVGTETGAEYDAELRDWSFKRLGKATLAFGRVFADQRGRWPDGYAIATSAVLAGPHREGAVIQTQNTRYLLSGPKGDLAQLQELAFQQKANAERRTRVANDARLFDLLQVAWGMDDETFEKIAELPARWMWQWRNHYRSPSDEELARIRRLAGFHDAIRIVSYGGPNYAAWWRRRWGKDSLIGEQTPLEAVLQDLTVLDTLERYLRAQM